MYDNNMNHPSKVLDCSVQTLAIFCTMLHQAKMVEIFTDLHATYKNIPSRMKAESFKQRVVSCFKAWEVRKKIHCLDPDFVQMILKRTLNPRTGRSTHPSS